MIYVVQRKDTKVHKVHKRYRYAMHPLYSKEKITDKLAFRFFCKHLCTYYSYLSILSLLNKLSTTSKEHEIMLLYTFQDKMNNMAASFLKKT